MIKVSLTEKFHEDVEIDKIYEELAIKVKSSLGDNPIECKYNGSEYILCTKEDIKAFLLARDFYNYSFDSIFEDLFTLRGNIKVGKLIDGTTSSEEGKAFYKRYNREEYLNIFNALLNYSSQTLTALEKTEVKEDELSGLEEARKKIKIFDYDFLSSLNRHKILTKMHVPVCPYCNVNYTSDYENEGLRNTTADLDHFYSQKQYPKFALCLYNFVPSCNVCNSKLKNCRNMSQKTHVFPHENSFEGKAKFQIMNKTQVLMNNNEEIKIKLINCKNDEKIKKSIEIFKINERYEYHKNVAKELLDKALIYNESYRDELSEKEDLFSGKYSIKSLVFGPPLTEDDCAKQSLGKLKKDLLNQLGIYK